MANDYLLFLQLSQLINTESKEKDAQVRLLCVMFQGV